MQTSTVNTILTWAIPVLVFLFASGFMFLAYQKRKHDFKKQKEREEAERKKNEAGTGKENSGRAFFNDDDQPVDNLVNAVNDIKPHDFSKVEDEE